MKNVNAAKKSVLRIIFVLIVVLSILGANKMDEPLKEAKRQDELQAKVDPFPGVYAVRGIISNEAELIESSGGASLYRTLF